MRKAIFILLALILVACGGQAEPVVETVQVIVEETAVPTNTPEPTEEPTPEPTEEANAEDEWVTYAVVANGFYLDLPATWREVPLDAETLDGVVQTIQDENPEIAEYLSSDVIQQFLLSGASFLGFDLSIKSILMSSPANINVIKERRLSPVSIEFHLETTKGILENFPNVSSEVVSEVIQLPYGNVGKQSFELTIMLPDGSPLERETLQYVFIDGVEIYTLTFSYDESDAERYAPILEQIASSFSLGEAPDGAILTGPAEETVIDATVASQIVTSTEDEQLQLLKLAENIGLIVTGNFLDSDNGQIPDIVAASAQSLGITLPDFDQVEPFDLVSLSMMLDDVRAVLKEYARNTYGERGAAYTDLIFVSQIAQILYIPDLDNPLMDAIGEIMSESASTAGIPSEWVLPIVDGMANNIEFDANSAANRQLRQIILADVEAGVIDISEPVAENTAVSDTDTTNDSTLNPQWMLTKLAESLAIAGLSQGLGLSEEMVAENLDLAELLASEMGISYPDIYEAVPFGDLQAGLGYVFDTQAILMAYAESNMGPEEAAVVELIMSGKIAQALYDQEDEDQTEVFKNTLVPAAYNSGLPEEIFITFLENLNNNESWQTVGDSINQMVFDINQLFEDEPVELGSTLPEAKNLFWNMGRQLAIAGIGQAFDLSQDIIDDSYIQVLDYADMLGITIPDLDENVPKGDSLAAFEYVFSVQSLIGEHASANYDSEHEGLVGIGVQSVFINILYEAGNENMSSILETRLLESVALTNIPESQFAPITNGFANNIPESEMQQHIDDLEDFMNDYTATD